MKPRFVLIGTVVAALAMFAWGTISHVVLPWHDFTVKPFPDGGSVVETVRANAAENGIYYATEGLFIAVDLLPGLPDKSKSIVGNLGLQFPTDVVVAFLLALALLGIRCPPVMSLAGFFAMIGVIAGVAIYVPHWNWHGFSPIYTLINIIDTTITFFIAGLVLATVARKVLPGTSMSA